MKYDGSRSDEYFIPEEFTDFQKEYYGCLGLTIF